MVADRPGAATGYALDKLQLRGELFVAPGEPVYEGMVVGESSRPGDMVVNVTREKQKTNIRTHASDEAIKLAPPRRLTIESAIEVIVDDELVESYTLLVEKDALIQQQVNPSLARQPEERREAFRRRRAGCSASARSC